MASDAAAGREHRSMTHVAVALTISATHTTYAPVRVDREHHRDIDNGTITAVHRTVGNKDKIPLARWRVGHQHLQQKDLKT